MDNKTNKVWVTNMKDPKKKILTNSVSGGIYLGIGL